MRRLHIIPVLIISLFFVQGQLINWVDYVQKIGQRVIELLELQEITGNGLPVLDAINYINKTLYGKRAEGTLRFHSGFVVKISEASFKSTSYKSTNGDMESTIYAQLSLKGLDFLYDVQYNLSEYKDNGSLRLRIPETAFDLWIRKNHLTDVVTGTLTYLSTGSQNLMEVYVYPSNAYTQLTAKEVKLVYDFRQNLTASIQKWDVLWQIILDVALAEIPFPQLCYYCP